MFNQIMAEKIYLLGSRILGDNVDLHLEKLKKSQWFSTDELLELQWNKLIVMLNHACNSSTFYKKKFLEYGTKLDDIKYPDDIVKVPILSKSDLKRCFNEIKIANGKYNFSIAKSSGSTGEAVKFLKDRNASGNGRAAMYRGHSWYGVDIGDREARLWGVPLDFKGKAAAKVGDYILNRFREKNFQLTVEVMNSFYIKIKKHKPAYLMGYSSLVYEFAQYLRSEKIEAHLLGLKMVKVTAESIFDYQRQVVEEVFQCPVVSEYGAAEVGIVTFECPYHNHHITAEGVFVEELDSQIEQYKELLVTDLDNFYTPIIRYQLGDYGKLSHETCQCGRGLPLLDNILGRTSDVVYKADGTPVHSSIFSYILKDITGKNGGIKHYKIYQKKKGLLDIEIVKDTGFDQKTLNYLKINIFKQLGEDVHLNIKYVNSIKRERSGKLRYFISEIEENGRYSER